MSTFQQARAQCLKALDIIDSTQLSIFLQRELLSREALLTQIDALESLSLDESISGMQALLNEVLSVYNDPFANYITPKQHKAYTQRRTGGFVGIGIKYRAMKDEYPLVIGPLLGGPLEHENIQPGDKLISADNEDLKAKSSREVSNLLKGEPESIITLGLKRDETQFDLKAQRQAVQLHYARAEMLESDIGYLKVSRFGGKTHLRVKTLLQELLDQNAKGIVLDLRDNPGGSTRAARNMMSMFDAAPWVFCEQYKNGTVKRLPREGEPLTDLPLVVLVNEYSMSSSEILAGALQDYKRATLVGAPTYGKGLIQRVFPLSEPLGGAVRTTIAMYGTPSHKLLHGRGLVPDIFIPTPVERLYRETGSVNISARARAFRTSLLIEQLEDKYSADVLKAHAAFPDAQLAAALSTLDKQIEG